MLHSLGEMKVEIVRYSPIMGGKSLMRLTHEIPTPIKVVLK